MQVKGQNQYYIINLAEYSGYYITIVTIILM